MHMTGNEERDPEDVDEDEQGQDDAYARRGARLRSRMARWLAGSPYLRTVSRPLVRALVECDSMCAELYDQYMTGHDVLVAKIWNLAAQRRSQLIRMLGGDDKEEKEKE